jgi:hypothetical protein
MESQGYLGILHSNPLGVMCQPFFRCIAAGLSIADPDLADGSAIFFAVAGATAQGESTQSRRPVIQGIGTRGQRIHGVSREG